MDPIWVKANPNLSLSTSVSSGVYFVPSTSTTLCFNDAFSNRVWIDGRDVMAELDELRAARDVPSTRVTVIPEVSLVGAAVGAALAVAAKNPAVSRRRLLRFWARDEED